MMVHKCMHEKVDVAPPPPPGRVEIDSMEALAVPGSSKAPQFSRVEFRCHYCEKPFTTKRSMEQHAWTHMEECRHTCSVCNKTFAQRSNLLQLMRVCREGGHCQARSLRRSVDRILVMFSSSFLRPTEAEAQDLKLIQTSLRYHIKQERGEANNKYLEGFNPQMPSKHIIYLDANNLYGWAMSQSLPLRDFSWVENVDHITPQVIHAVPDDGPQGYIFEVDLQYPLHLHDHHSNYPLVPEQMLVTPEMLSPHSLQIAEEMGVKIGACEKLVPNLMDKHHYIIHFRNLKQCFKLEMILKKIHQCIRFTQSP